MNLQDKFISDADDDARGKLGEIVSSVLSDHWIEWSEYALDEDEGTTDFSELENDHPSIIKEIYELVAPIYGGW